MCMKCIFIFLAILTTCFGSHFRGALFSWRPKDIPNKIEILYRLNWRRSGAHFCNESTISSGTILAGGSLSCFKNCNESTIAVLNYFCTDFSETEDWTTGTGSITYTFPSSKTYFEFGFKGAAWIPLVSGGSSWEMRTKAYLAIRSDTGRINSPPQFDISPIVRLAHGCQHTIGIPGRSTCTVTYDAIGTNGYYGVAIQVEDFTAGSTTPLSSAPIQFLINVYNITSGCNSVPEFLPPTRPNQNTFFVNPNGTFTEIIVARSRIPMTDIKEITTLSPPGFSKSVLRPYPSLPGAWYIDVTWNPTKKFSNQTLVFCFSATDKSG
ncbi:hypothetical protein CHS0354_005978 [Potamilus streckersoni]|uniref:Uncharacterized protein n=1 Tax=Potamilus streckersoni TaxID=2493646 RepID=A0AAE0VHK2_9BIVA|nr:hypothetical protein CHS0354_005978 [Potamilus streckersoni]